MYFPFRELRAKNLSHMFRPNINTMWRSENDWSIELASVQERNDYPSVNVVVCSIGLRDTKKHVLEVNMRQLISLQLTPE